MDKATRKKFRGTYIFLAVTATGFVATTLIAVSMFTLCMVRNGQIESLEGTLRTYASRYGADPDISSHRRQKILKDAHVVLQDFEDIFQTLPMADGPLTPLSFKQQLFLIQNRLRSQAAAHGTGMPDTLGFADYELDVPPQDHVVRLNREALMLEDVINRLLKSDIAAITAVSFIRPWGEKETQAAAADALPIRMNISFEADFAGIKNSLEQLAQADVVYVVNAFTMRNTTGAANKLAATLEVEYVAL